MAKKEKPATVAAVPTDDQTRMIREIQARFKKLVIGSYFPHKKMVEFVAYLEGLIPKAKAVNATTKPEPVAEPIATAGAPLRSGYVGRDSAGDAGQSASR